MTAHVLYVMRRKARRTHLSGADYAPLCGTITAVTGAHVTPIELIGGATTRLRVDLTRELDNNTCLHCTRIARGMLALYVSRDRGTR